MKHAVKECHVIWLPHQQYYWFYQKSEMAARGMIKNSTHISPRSGNFNLGATGTAAGIPANILLIWRRLGAGSCGNLKTRMGKWYEKLPMEMTHGSAQYQRRDRLALSFRTAIRWIHRLVTLALLALIVGFINGSTTILIRRKSDELPACL